MKNEEGKMENTNIYVSYDKKGITLIALIITIILLLILAGVTISLTLGENGLFKTAQEATIEHEKATLKEELEIEIASIQARKYANGEEISREDLFELSKIGAVVEEVEIPTLGEYKDYYFEIDENYNVTILDKIDTPRIRITDVTPLGFTIVVNDNYADGFVEEYKYYLNEELISNGITDKTYKVTGLYEGTEYSVYVEACTTSESIKSNVVTTTTETVTSGIRLNGSTAVVTNLAQSDIYTSASGEYTVAMRVKINRTEQASINYMGLFGLHNDTSGMQIQFTGTSTQIKQADYVSYYDKWTDLVVTYNNTLLKLYFNGELVYEQTVSRGPYPSKFVIGNSYKTTRYMKGSIASVKVWSKELTANEVMELDMGQKNASIQTESLKLETRIRQFGRDTKDWNYTRK